MEVDKRRTDRTRHDHRVHWMDEIRSDGVVADPNKRQEVQKFTLDVSQGVTKFVVSGVLEWIPGPNPVLPGTCGGVGRRVHIARSVGRAAQRSARGSSQSYGDSE